MPCSCGLLNNNNGPNQNIGLFLQRQKALQMKRINELKKQKMQQQRFLQLKRLRLRQLNNKK